MTRPATTAFGAAAFSTASAAVSQSRHDHQQGSLVPGSLPHGRWVHPRQPHPAADLQGVSPDACSGKLGIERIAALSHFHSRARRGCTRSVAQTTAHQLRIDTAAAALPAHLFGLSNLGSLAGSTDASNGCQKIGKVCQNGGSRDYRNALN